LGVEEKRGWVVGDGGEWGGYVTLAKGRKKEKWIDGRSMEAMGDVGEGDGEYGEDGERLGGGGLVVGDEESWKERASEKGASRAKVLRVDVTASKIPVGCCRARRPVGPARRRSRRFNSPPLCTSTLQIYAIGTSRNAAPFHP
jgi:hypothetical protein